MLINQVFRAGSMKTMHWILQYRMQNLRTRSSLTRRGGRGKGLTIVHVCQLCSTPPCYLPCFSFFFLVLCMLLVFYLLLSLLLVVAYFDYTAPLFTLFHNDHHQMLSSTCFCFSYSSGCFCGLLTKKFISLHFHLTIPKTLLIRCCYLIWMTPFYLFILLASINRTTNKSRHRMNDMSQESNAAEIVTFWTILQEASNNIVLEKVSVDMKVSRK